MRVPTEESETMNVFLLVAGGGPMVILTSYPSVTDPGLLRKLAARGITKFVAFEIPLEKAQERYGAHFFVTKRDLRDVEDLRILDDDGRRAFSLFRFDELSSPILHEPPA